MKKLFTMYTDWMRGTTLGRIFLLLACADIATLALGWEYGHQAVLLLVELEMLVWACFGIRWTYKKLAGMIANELRRYVRRMVQEELRSSSRAYQAH